jgi:formylglycine-generating enzyme required for sulfatase activity
MWIALQRGLESKQGDRQFRTIPILLPNATRGDRAKLPRFLTAYTWVEFHRSIEDPLAMERLTKAIRGEAPGAGFKLPVGESPYRGIEFFDLQHANRFFGRETLTDWLLSRLRGTVSKDGPTRFLAIVGASGSGKSSLARAGLLAKLQASEEVPGSPTWTQVILRPENRPLESLATALVKKLEPETEGKIARSNTIENLMGSLLESPTKLHMVAQALIPENDPNWRLVVFVDQFEELFTLNVANAPSAPGEPRRLVLSPDRIAFVQNLLRAAMIPNGRTIVILTMRADFYGKCASFPELSDAVSAFQELVGPMTPDELRRAIESPALLSGMEIESGLVDLLVEEVSGQSGALPLLQFALEELWTKSRERGFRKLTAAAYRELGGWKGGLSRRANAVLDKFRNTPDEKLCRELFLRLVQPGEGTEDTKRLVRWEELQDADPSQAEALEHVVRTLADERLITTGTAESSDEKSGRRLAAGATVEVIHEALIRDWVELRGWLDADREGLRTHRQLTEAANEWVKSAANSRQRDPSLLYTGSRLAAARELSARGTVTLNAQEAEFVSASTRAIRAKKRRAVAGWVGTLTVIGLLAAVGTIVAIQQRDGAVARNDVEKTVENLASAEPAELSKIIKKLAQTPDLAATFLQQRRDSLKGETPEEKRQQLHYQLALVGRDKSLVAPLLEELLNNKIAYIGPISEQLRPYAGEMTEKLWGILRNDQAIDKHPAKHPAKQRLHAAAALAHSAADLAAESWTKEDLEFVARQLVSENAEFQPLLRKNLRSISEQLLPDLEQVFSDPKSTDGQRLSAANALADYAANEIPRLSRLLSVATPEQFRLLYPIVESQRGTTTVETLSKIAATRPPVELGSVARIGFGQQRANAAITLLRLGEREQAMTVFDMTDDPEALTQFIFRCREREVSAEALLDCLDMVSQAPADRYPKNSRYGLLLALGEYSLENEIPEARREALVAQLVDWHRHDPSSGVHGASGWLLRQWGRTEIARQVDQTPVPYTDGCEWFTLAISVPLTAPSKRPQKSTVEQAAQDPALQIFYYTFIVFPSGDYEIGSPEDEPNRSKNELRHLVKLTLPFAVLDREITFEELIAFQSVQYKTYMERADGKPEFAGGAVDWNEATSFCNWMSKQSAMAATSAEKRQAKFRMPTETEWEVSGRAGTRTSYGFGSDTSLLKQFGWFEENSGKHGHSPRELRPNLRGLFDMHGNQFEWVNDLFAEYDLTKTTDPKGPAVSIFTSGSIRVNRGGGWDFNAANCRMACRYANAPTNRSFVRGFRVALSPSGASSPEAGPVQRAEPLGGGTEGAPAEQRPELP